MEGHDHQHQRAWSRASGRKKRDTKSVSSLSDAILKKGKHKMNHKEGHKLYP